ncbi:MAG: ABC transporter ATP-binding protein, partial [Pyrinomonadaceae bacterium]|nr:ABC transporter ATP-binding protein [Pyrinomonadaceae bacterium]
AIVIEPRLLLFDEPLSNLDVGLREETRQELRELVKKLNLTAVYVTHDQDEAFSLCDRIAVMQNGELLQIGTPREIYEKPENAAVAKFLGRNNLIRAARISSKKEILQEFQTLDGEHRIFVDADEIARMGAINQIVTLGIRPENLVITFGAAFPEDNLLRAAITKVEYLGATTRVTLDANGLMLEALVLRLVGLKVGQVCMVGLPTNRISILKS